MLSLIELDTITPQGVYKQIEKEAKSVGIETMYALCKEADVNYTTVNKWGQGLHEPNFRIVRELLKPIQKRLIEAGLMPEKKLLGLLPVEVICP